jgi:hypothetical protein
MTPSRTTPESDPMTRSRLSEAPLIVVDGVTVWRPEDQEDPLIKIEVGGSVHVRKASEWHALAVASFALSETASNRDAKDAARYRWLRAHHRTDVSHRLTWYLPRWASLDAAGLDAAIDGNLEDDAAESARNEYGGIGVARDGTDV